MKIKEKYLNPIRNGIKKHEFRLATKERQTIRIGDILILVSNLNNFNYVKVTVKNVEHYENWEKCLEKYWKSDFKENFSSLDETLHECYKFYSRDDVNKYGIEVFEIEPHYVDPKESSVLLDTNIVIHRESSNNIAYEVIQLYKSLEKLKVNKCVIKDIKDEIKKHKDKQIVENMLAKVDAYNVLETENNYDKNFVEAMSTFSLKENSKIDNKFLYEVYKDKVDFLITDDKGILAKAKTLYLDDRVLCTNDFLRLVEKKYPSLTPYKVLSVDLCKISSLDINDKFYDSLREDYEGIKFNKWFEKKGRDGEEAYVFRNESGIQGFLYLKIENENESYDDIKPKFLPKRRLKVGTFKINRTGLRVGERFLKIIFDYASKSDVDEIYVTLFENKRDEVKVLMKLMESWGFEKWGYKISNGELVLVKKMKTYNYKKDPKFNYPNLMTEKKYGILPIEAQFHTDLFPDLFLRNEDMSLFEEKPCSYAVEKIYVCGTKHIQRKPGDLLAIYRMSDKLYKGYSSVISGICILQEVIYPTNFEDFKSICTNRSVFDDKQLEKFYYENGYKIILKVLFLKPLESKIVLNDLRIEGIINDDQGPRLTTQISEENFDKLLLMGGIKL